MAGALHGVLASLKAAAASATDTFFRYVSLLLNTTSTNGAQNSTFLDSSTNNFSITRNGNTTQGTFSPFSQTGWSNFFDGNGDNLSIAHNTALNLSSGDFTLEAWVYWNGANVNAVVMDKDGVAASGYPQYQIALNGSGFLRFLFGGGPSVFQELTSSTAMPKNVWVHVAGVKSGTNMSLYQDGVSVASATQTATITDNARALLIGYSTGQPANAYFDGYISNARIVKGTAVYTSNFTPPTSPLTAIANTSLLTCQSNRFIDNSSNAFAITRNGDVSVQAFSPFNPTAAWSASTNGGSGYFDGNGDFLVPPLNTALNPGTGDFTFECWFYATAPIGFSAIFEGTNNGLSIGFNSGKVAVAESFIAYLITDPSNFVINQWVHIAASRLGTTLSLFVNGTRVGTITNSTNFASSTENRIGRDAVTNYITGYLSNLRIVKGTAVYDPTLTTLTVPAAPLTAITNTSLLLNFTNAGIFDSASGNDLETVGNAQVSTVQAKWGTTSLAFDGTGDWLVQIDRPALRLGTAAFTIEMWVYRSASGTYGLVSKGTSTTGWSVSLNASNQVVFSFAASSFNSTGTVAATTWTHIAVVREGTGASQTKIYINGTNDGTGTVATDFSGTDVMYVGADRVAGSNFNGYIDDLRITNGIARYTSNFTAPTAAFPLN